MKMKSKNELKEIGIKIRAWHYFDNITYGTEINFSNISSDKKLYENNSAYDISYKTSTTPEPSRIRFNKIDGLFIILDGRMKHLILFDFGLFEKMCHKIKYPFLISKKNGIRNSINHNFGKIRIDLYNLYPLKNINFS